MITIHVQVSETDIAAIDDLVKHHMYPSMSDAVRFAIRDLLKLHDKIP